MVYLLPLVFALGSLGLMLGLTIWALRRKKREGAWRVPTIAALLLALVVACGAMGFWISLLGTVASADAASRATMLARVIAQTINATCFACYITCPLLLAFAGYRFYVIRKAKKPRG
jgi:hypothetical protein